MSADIESATSAMWYCPCPADYGDWFKLLCAIKDAGVPKDEARRWCESGEGFDAAVFESKWKRGIKENGAVKAATLYGMAIDAGWKDPAKPRHNGHSKPQAITLAASTIRPQKTPQKAGKSVSELWARFAPATDDHAYTIAKRGRADGLRVVPADDALTIAGQSVAGWLVVPALSLDGELRSMQFIPPPGIGKKLNMPGASFDDGLFVVGNLAESARIFIVEGIGQAWACWQATGCAAVVTFGSGRMSAVAEILRRRFPALPLVLVADRGKENQVAEIARSIRGAWVEMPSSRPSNFDCNDYAAEYGADELGELLDKPKAPVKAEPSMIMPASEFIKGYQPLDHVVDGIIIRGFLYGLTSRPNHGKTTVANTIGLHVADSKPFAGLETSGGRVLFLAGENPDDFRLRLIATAQHFGLSLDHVEVLPRAMPLAANIHTIVAECHGDYALVIVDTSAAFYSYENEDDNVSSGDHARDLRQLTTLPGHPAVMVCCHPTKNADKENLVPRGGSAFIAELDTNLTLWNEAGTAELSHGKIRGPTFNPIALSLMPVTLSGYSDHKGRPVGSVVAVPLSESQAGEAQHKALQDDNRVLYAMLHHPNGSMAEWASTCGWIKDGTPTKWKVDRALKRLITEKLVKRYRGRYVLTDAGKREAGHVE
ncbi:MAG: AAA family ATPase [Sterolibacterium sp.]